MRFSPVLVAVLAASATLGLSNAAKGETPNVVSLDAASVGLEGVTGQLGQAPTIGLAATGEGKSTAEQKAPSRDRIIPLQGIAPPERLTQAPATPVSPTTAPGQATPAPATDGSPQQDTPDRIQINTTPAPTGTPQIQPETPSAPAEAQPAPVPTPTPTTAPTAEPTPTGEPEPRVLVSEVAVSGVSGNPEEAKLLDAIYGTIRTQPGQTTTRSQLQEDINAIFATGFFLNVRAVPEDTPLGVRVTFDVQPNPVLAVVEVRGSSVLPQAEVDKAFSPLYGKILNLVELQNGIKKINKWYQDNGFVLAQITDAPKVSEDGKVILDVAEGVVEDIQVRFLNKEGQEFVEDKEGNPVTDKEGNPVRVRGRTRPFIVTREFELKPGEVFNRNKVQRDLQRVFGLNIFEDVKLSFKPGQDPRKVIVSVDVTERNTGSVAAGAGISSASGLFGTLSYQEQNFGGNNQKLGAEVQLGIRELLFDLSFSDPWIAGDPYRTSYTVNAFRRRTISLIFDGGDDEVKLPNGDRPRVNRIGSGLSFVRPLARNPFVRSQWTASLGLQYQRVSIRDSDGNLSPKDELGNNLSFSGEGKDDLFTVQLGVVQDLRDNPLRPIKGSLLRLGTEQSVPIGIGSIFFNRLRASYSYYMPTQLLRFTKGCRATKITASDCPQAFAFNVQAGTVVGDLPPYEAFSLGGSNSVRGYDEGELGSGRSFALASVEYRFPLFSVISGALFFDAATDLGSADQVPGNPAGVRGKPGSGFGYGVGVRVQSPLGPIRIDYGFNDQGDSRLHFGIGERF
ncbi:MAG: BamA/TamA family outer membrane protein [Scytolyngbya sp. HA4215-MV1]|jgi:outer membrane protein insertion porin family|nr:BamA/TamA family outer membrane protein [Scytolyngbya sp. HA4215-MV1]